MEDLIKWSNDRYRKPLILWGARQVGKTYLVKDLFAERFYKNKYIYVDCKLDNKFRKICSNTVNPKIIIEYLSLTFNMELNNETLVIFDEIQQCPNLITSLKYFFQDYKYIPIIATGSMVRISLNRMVHRQGVKKENSDFLFPVGKIDELTLTSMSFDEYLYNKNERIYDLIKQSYIEKKPLDENYHEKLIGEIYQYLFVGSMPEAVDIYLKTNSYFQSRKILIALYNNYLNDMQLYQVSNEAIIRSKIVFNNIYRLLNRESKNFSPSFIETNTKNRDFRSAIDWLIMAKLLQPSYQLKEHVTLPFYVEDDSTFRLYLSDIGMFTYQSGADPSTFLTKDNDNTLSGIYFENYVANQLVSKGLPLYYWKGKRNSEMEFLLQKEGRIYPVDVKKNKGSLNSLDSFAFYNKYEVAIKISRNNFSYSSEKKIVNIPFYDV